MEQAFGFSVKNMSPAEIEKFTTKNRANITTPSYTTKKPTRPHYG